jgi:hypothetical protein
MSVVPLVSAATSASSVSKNTCAPFREIPSKITSKAPLPPVGPVEIRVVVPPER